MKKEKLMIFCGILSSTLLMAESPIIVKQHDRIKELEQYNNQLVVDIAEKDVLIEDLSSIDFTKFPIKDQFKLAAQVYETDWILIYSIAAHETGWFKSNLFLNNNNPGGIKAGSSGWAKYDNTFQGICEMTRLIKKSYIDQGLTTPEKMELKYCPDGSAWAKNVNKIISEVKNTEEAH